MSGLALRNWVAAISCALAFGVALFSFGGPTRAAAANTAEGFVQQNIDKGYVILNNSQLSDGERRGQFRDFMLGLTDTKRIGTFTLGQYANSAPKADVDAFTNAFTDYAVAVYESRLSKYKGQSLKVTGSVERAADDVVVNADVINPGAASNAQPFKVAFRVRKTSDARPIITDIQVEGIWLALSQRSDFTAFLQQHNGSVTALTDDLKRQTAQLRANPSNGVAQKS
jgi:phospholipid transport system substrate-binding protein